MHVTDCTMFCSAFQFTIGLGVCGLLANVLDCKASGQGQGSTPGNESEGMCFSSSDLTQHVQTDVAASSRTLCITHHHFEPDSFGAP